MVTPEPPDDDSGFRCSGPCILWTRGISSTGYGTAYVDGKAMGAHRAAWVEAHGPIPDGLFVLHRCDVRACVNVSHLFLGTAADNVRDMHEKGRDRNGHDDKTHCPKGHPYEGDNLYVKRNGWRGCRECDRVRSRENQRRLREQRRADRSA